jgi:hypothetical protein
MSTHSEARDQLARRALGLPPEARTAFIAAVAERTVGELVTVISCSARRRGRHELDTFDPLSTSRSARLAGGDRITVGPRSMVVLRGPMQRG